MKNYANIASVFKLILLLLLWLDKATGAASVTHVIITCAPSGKLLHVDLSLLASQVVVFLLLFAIQIVPLRACVCVLCVGEARDNGMEQ